MKHSEFKYRAAAVSSVLSLALLAGAPAWAHGDGGDDHGGGPGGGSHGVSTTKLRARLSALGDPSTEVYGKAERQTKTKKDGRIDDRFSAKVKIPCPNTALGILSCEESDFPTEIHLTLQRPADTTPAADTIDGYADCTLEFDQVETEFDDDGNKAQAEYKVDGRLKKGETQFKKGSCTDGTSTPGGIPGVQAGDTARVWIVNGSSPDFIAAGKFNLIQSRGKRGR